MTVLTKTTPFGNLSAPGDTADFAVAVKGQAQACLNACKTDSVELEGWVTLLRQNDRFKILKDSRQRAIGSWKRFCEMKQPYGLGYSSDAIKGIIDEGKTVEERAEAAPGREELSGPEPGRKPSNCDSVTIRSTGSGNSADYLTARIARARPDILERMKAGEFPSVRQAAIEAGIVKVPTPLDGLRREWKKATGAERTQFLQWTKK